MEESKGAWLMVEHETDISGLAKAVSVIGKNQQETASALQKLLSGLTEKLDTLNQRFMAIQEKIAALEHKMLENDIREQNRRLRTHDAFSFQARKIANPWTPPSSSLTIKFLDL